MKGVFMSLSPKQEKFCLEYKKCGNASEAYRRVYNIQNMKSRSINQRAYELIHKPKILNRLSELQKEIQKESILTARQIQEELTRYILDQREEECIVIEANSDRSSNARRITKKVQPKDKLKAIELLCKLAGYNVEQEQVAIPISINFTRNYD